MIKGILSKYREEICMLHILEPITLMKAYCVAQEGFLSYRFILCANVYFDRVLRLSLCRQKKIDAKYHFKYFSGIFQLLGDSVFWVSKSRAKYALESIQSKEDNSLNEANPLSIPLKFLIAVAARCSQCSLPYVWSCVLGCSSPIALVNMGKYQVGRRHSTVENKKKSQWKHFANRGMVKLHCAAFRMAANEYIK